MRLLHGKVRCMEARCIDVYRYIQEQIEDQGIQREFAFMKDIFSLI